MRMSFFDSSFRQIESREKHQTKKVSHEMALPDEKLQISQKNQTEMCHRQT